MHGFPLFVIKFQFRRFHSSFFMHLLQRFRHYLLPLSHDILGLLLVFNFVNKIASAGHIWDPNYMHCISRPPLLQNAPTVILNALDLKGVLADDKR